MKQIRIGRYNVELYESIDEMPIDVYHNYNKYLIIDSNIGTDIGSVSLKLNKIAQYIKIDKKDSAIDEINNMLQNINFALEGRNAKALSFISLIHTINGEVITDRSIENMERIRNKLNKMTIGTLNGTVDGIKKKTKRSLPYIFLRYLILGRKGNITT